MMSSRYDFHLYYALLEVGKETIAQQSRVSGGLCIAITIVANESRCYIYDVFYHWLRPCMSIEQMIPVPKPDGVITLRCFEEFK